LRAEPLILRILDTMDICEQPVGPASPGRIRVAGGLNCYGLVAVLEDMATVIS
jgi:hypothetical protein